MLYIRVLTETSIGHDHRHPVIEVSVFFTLIVPPPPPQHLPQAEGGSEKRLKRKRLGSSSSRSATKQHKTETTVTHRPDLRAKFYSKVTYLS